MRERRFTLHDHCLKQLGIEARRGSITPGKDADFLVFDNDLLTAEQEGFGYNKPRDVYFRGKKMNEKLNPPAMLGRLEEDVSGMRK